MNSISTMLIIVFNDHTCVCPAKVEDLRFYIGRSDVLRVEERESLTAPTLRVLTLRELRDIREAIL